jgi:hypothetical protein
MPRRSEPKIESLADLEDFIYEMVGIIDMEEVRQILDLIKKHKDLLEEHR